MIHFYKRLPKYSQGCQSWSGRLRRTSSRCCWPLPTAKCCACASTSGTLTTALHTELTLPPTLTSWLWLSMMLCFFRSTKLKARSWWSCLASSAGEDGGCGGRKPGWDHWQDRWPEVGWETRIRRRKKNKHQRMHRPWAKTCFYSEIIQCYMF